jgi:hypothetical protein
LVLHEERADCHTLAICSSTGIFQGWANWIGRIDQWHTWQHRRLIKLMLVQQRIADGV